MSENRQFDHDASIVSAVGIIGNLVLTLFKALAGIVGHSGAMLSDAVHSASDVLSSIIAIIGIRFSTRASDQSHPYGHERFECVAAIILAVILASTGVQIGIGAGKHILGGSYETLETPGVLALIAAVVSIVVKEAMYWYTKHYADKHDSSALRASAWDHRSDAFSSVGALIGIAGARMGVRVLDPVASLVICVFIIKAAYSIFMDAIEKMVDHACSEEVERQLRACVSAQEGVMTIDLLATREFGNRIYVDLEIGADGALSLVQGHEIAERVHDAVEQAFPKVKHIMVHVNPVLPDGREPDGDQLSARS